MSGSRKHKPQRTCVICRTVSEKRTLTRLVMTPDQGIQIDRTGKQPGRGAYLCNNPECWLKAAGSDALARALRTQLTEEMRAMIAAHGAQLAASVEGV